MVDDETWIFLNDPETIHQTLQRKIHECKLQVITMLTWFFETKGFINYESVPPNQINKHSTFEYENVYSNALLKMQHCAFLYRIYG
jgi:hypothetical protein